MKPNAKQLKGKKEKINTPLEGVQKHRYGVKLGNAHDCRRLLSKQINGVLKGQCSSETLRVVSYAVSVLLKTLEQGSLEERIGILERKFTEQGGIK